MGMVNIFRLPEETIAEGVAGEGKANMKVSLVIQRPGYLASLFGPELTIPLQTKEVDLKFRGMGVMGDMQTIAQKMEIPESGATAELPVAVNTTPVQSASINGVSVQNGQGMPYYGKDESRGLAERTGIGIGNFLAKIFSL
jgi:hypothetical protein